MYWNYGGTIYVNTYVSKLPQLETDAWKMRSVLLIVEFGFYYNEILIRMSSLHQNLLRLQSPLYFRRLDLLFLKQFVEIG